MKFKALTVVSATLLTLGLVQSTMAQDTQYGQGLLLDYYVIENEGDVNEPTGRSMATLVDTAAPQMSYLAPFSIEPRLEQFRDKFWGLLWTGFLKVDDAGPYSFNLLGQTAIEEKGVEGLKCVSWLKLQDRNLVTHELKTFSGNKNAYGDTDLRPGIYEVEVWLGCNSSPYTSPEEVKLEMIANMRGPNDAMLKPIPKNQLLHEL